jgi:hypothetical protein
MCTGFSKHTILHIYGFSMVLVAVNRLKHCVLMDITDSLSFEIKSVYVQILV